MTQKFFENWNQRHLRNLREVFWKQPNRRFIRRVSGFI
jgi:hypothetical protein